MKKLVFMLIALLFMVNLSVYSLYEHPSNPECGGKNYRIDKNFWSDGSHRGAWFIQTRKMNSDGSLDWANYKCEGVGTECRRGDWATIWSLTSNEPPLPSEPGTWQSLYFIQFPTQYDPSSGLYY